MRRTTFVANNSHSITPLDVSFRSLLKTKHQSKEATNRRDATVTRDGSNNATRSFPGNPANFFFVSGIGLGPGVGTVNRNTEALSHQDPRLSGSSLDNLTSQSPLN